MRNKNVSKQYIVHPQNLVIRKAFKDAETPQEVGRQRSELID